MYNICYCLIISVCDRYSKFWTRNRPGDAMRDKYNLNTMPVGMAEDMLEFGEWHSSSLATF